jgi:hypothetical protein
MAMLWPSILPVTPFHVWNEKDSTSDWLIPFSSALATIAEARGCSLPSSMPAPKERIFFFIQTITRDYIHKFWLSLGKDDGLINNQCIYFFHYFKGLCVSKRTPVTAPFSFATMMGIGIDGIIGHLRFRPYPVSNDKYLRTQ